MGKLNSLTDTQMKQLVEILKSMVNIGKIKDKMNDETGIFLKELDEFFIRVHSLNSNRQFDLLPRLKEEIEREFKILEELSADVSGKGVFVDLFLEFDAFSVSNLNLIESEKSVKKKEELFKAIVEKHAELVKATEQAEKAVEKTNFQFTKVKKLLDKAYN
jgi:hypothetical protein